MLFPKFQYRHPPTPIPSMSSRVGKCPVFEAQSLSKVLWPTPQISCSACHFLTMQGKRLVNLCCKCAGWKFFLTIAIDIVWQRFSTLQPATKLPNKTSPALDIGWMNMQNNCDSRNHFIFIWQNQYKDFLIHRSRNGNSPQVPESKNQLWCKLWSMHMCGGI